jgi:hypothetical protein
VFFDIRGERSRSIYLLDNDLLESRVPYRVSPEVKPEEIKPQGNLERAGL